MTKEHLARWVDGISEPPDDGSADWTATYDSEVRDAILQSFQHFCQQLDLRLTIFTGNDPSMFEIFESDVNLRAEMVGQKVHTFLGRWLIEPTVAALEYEYIAEPRRSRLELNQNREDIHPDFRLIPRQWSGDVPPDIIGEIKNPGGFQSAVRVLGNKYLSKLEPPAYGLATDGLVWCGLKREADETIRLSAVSHVRLTTLLHRIRRDIVHDRASYEISQLRDSNELNRFISLFEQIPG